jgi:uncharacterized membrane protein
VRGWKYEPQMSQVRDRICECFDARCKWHLPENSDRLSVNFYNCSATWQAINNSTRFISHIGTNSLPTVTLLPFAQKNIWKSDLHYTGLTSLRTSKMIPFAHRLVNYKSTYDRISSRGMLQAQYRHPLQPPSPKKLLLFSSRGLLTQWHWRTCDYRVC